MKLMNPPWRVLVLPGGNEIGLEIRRALRWCKEVELVSAASDVPNHAPFVYAEHHILPGVDDPAFAKALHALVAAARIDAIFPAHAYVIDALLDLREELACVVVLPDTEHVRLTRSKRATLSLLADRVPVPAMPVDPGVDDLPLFVKPDAAYGSQGNRVVHHVHELPAETSDHLIQEVLTGPEYTVDCLSTRDELLFCGPRERQRVRMGTSMHARTVGGAVGDELRRMAAVIHQAIPMTGAWFFQAKADDHGVLKLLEVEARVAGTMALHRASGVNFPLLSLFLHAGLPVTVIPHVGKVVLDRALENRFKISMRFDHVYVDLDDTLVVHDRVNVELVAFLLRCHERGCRVTLISKSLAPDPDAYLRRKRLTLLFDEVIWLGIHDDKADHIDPVGAIFIDDSHSQRRDVARRHGIATFDPSMVELLLDERS